MLSFNVVTSTSDANVNNTGGSATAALTDVNGLTTSDYLLTFDGANAYTLTRQSDGQTTAINTGGASPFTTTTIDGFTLTLTAGAAVGDTFRIRPVADNADQMRVALTDPSRLPPPRRCAPSPHSRIAVMARSVMLP